MRPEKEPNDYVGCHRNFFGNQRKCNDLEYVRPAYSVKSPVAYTEGCLPIQFLLRPPLEVSCQVLDALDSRPYGRMTIGEV